MNKIKPCVLMILDGWGVGSGDEKDATFLAKTPNLTMLKNNYPHTELVCSGEAVGLPEGIMGNSEVGHLNIGAGRVVYQELLRIDLTIRDGSFFKNLALNSVMDKVCANNSALHLMGLISDGGVHSQLAHLFALLKMAKEKGIGKGFVHVILDGRDTPPDSGVNYVHQLLEYIRSIGFGEIATICGRYYAMDRDTRWDRTEKAYRLYTEGEGVYEKDPETAVFNAYQRGETDEFVKPVVITGGNSGPLGEVKDNDGVIFFNFRADRTRQITRAFTETDFKGFKRQTLPALCDFVCMTLYDECFTLPVAFPPEHLKDLLGEVISKKGLSQLRIAETEKYAHVTYFFNGGEENAFPLEDRCLIPSPRDVATYDLKPEMSAPKVTEEFLARLNSEKYDFIVLNFANMDMVGHTGIMNAAIKACETLDICIDRIVRAVIDKKGAVLITADHGNAEKMIEENGHPHTAHTLNPVPFILVFGGMKHAKLRNGVLGDIAPTILDILGIEKPAAMTGRSLIVSSSFTN